MTRREMQWDGNSASQYFKNNKITEVRRIENDILSIKIALE